MTISTPAQLRARTAYRQRQKAKHIAMQSALEQIKELVAHRSGPVSVEIHNLAQSALGDDA